MFFGTAIPAHTSIYHPIPYNWMATWVATSLPYQGVAFQLGPGSWPRALPRLIISSHFVGACTGKSAGLLALENAIDVAGRLLAYRFRRTPVARNCKSAVAAMRPPRGWPWRTR